MDKGPCLRRKGGKSASVDRANPKPVTAARTFVLRFARTIALWSVSLFIVFAGYELGLYALISAVGMIALWEFYGMLEHKRLPNFKVTAMICGGIMLIGSFYYFSHYGPARPYDFETAVLPFFLLTVFTRQLFSCR